MSVGIITGVFYSLTLFLSYRIFLRFLTKQLALISVLLLFLIHPYIIYPGANYFMYTFQLLALIFFFQYPKHRFYGLLSGFFLSMSVLSRYSSFIAVLPPFVIMLLWDLIAVKDARKRTCEKIMILSCGFLVPLMLFFWYLLAKSSLGYFVDQNRILLNIMGNAGDIETYLNFVASILQVVPSLASDFRGKLFTLILIICLFVIIRESVGKFFSRDTKTVCVRSDIIFICLIAVFGYLNSIHVYETVRLVNGSAIGVGICVFVFYNLFMKISKPLKYLMTFLIILLFLTLSSSLFFKHTTSSYYPWKWRMFFGGSVTNKTIAIFKGKLLTKEYNDFYQEVYDTLAPFKDSYYIINYTFDVVAFAMNDLRRVQITPVNYPGLDDVFKQANVIDRKEAIILSQQRLEFPGYTEIFYKKWPEEIPWLGGGHLFIYAPGKNIRNKKNLHMSAHKNKLYHEIN